jgi:hypothetical protein
MKCDNCYAYFANKGHPEWRVCNFNGLGNENYGFHLLEYQGNQCKWFFKGKDYRIDTRGKVEGGK